MAFSHYTLPPVRRPQYDSRSLCVQQLHSRAWIREEVTETEHRADQNCWGCTAILLIRAGWEEEMNKYQRRPLFSAEHSPLFPKSPKIISPESLVMNCMVTRNFQSCAFCLMPRTLVSCSGLDQSWHPKSSQSRGQLIFGFNAQKHVLSPAVGFAIPFLTQAQDLLKVNSLFAFLSSAFAYCLWKDLPVSHGLSRLLQTHQKVFRRTHHLLQHYPDIHCPKDSKGIWFLG